MNKREREIERETEREFLQEPPILEYSPIFLITSVPQMTNLVP